MSPAVPLLYSYTGGMPPETLEIFWVRPDRVAEYVAGNPWPAQPPFDEVGCYRRALSDEEWESLRRCAAAACAAGRGQAEPARSGDAGLEFVRVQLEAATAEREWSPARVPAACAPLVGRVRALITDTRDYPVSTVRATWCREAGPGGVPDLALHNRGSAPVVFYGLRANEETRARVRVRFVPVDPSRPLAPPNPLSLVRLEPVTASASPDWEPEAGGRVVLDAGQTLRMNFGQDETIARGTSRPPSALECLVAITFQRATPEGETLMERGWLMPEPFIVP